VLLDSEVLPPLTPEVLPESFAPPLDSDVLPPPVLSPPEDPVAVSDPDESAGAPVEPSLEPSADVLDEVALDEDDELVVDVPADVVEIVPLDPVESPESPPPLPSEPQAIAVRKTASAGRYRSIGAR
jgi:hypothetical protein